MKILLYPLFILASLVIAPFQSCSPPAKQMEVTWPEIKSESKPWTRWWWMASAVDRKGITAQMESFARAGVGGVEIAPIYGVKGEEERYIDFLSLQWMEMLKYATDEAKRLGMKVDMTQGTGWPFGGPHISRKNAAHKMLIEHFQLTEGEQILKPIVAYDEKNQPLEAPLQVLTAYGPNHQQLNLIDRVDNQGRLNWTAPKGSWEVIAGLCGNTNQHVKRAAPGGEGFVVDHLSKGAVSTYLARFDTVFEDESYEVRAMFNDSYEVYLADWTPDFLETFRQKRGYDLRLYIKDLISKADTEVSSRVKSDYRETMSDLILESFTTQWKNWAHEHQMLVKNQAHGSPGNLLDLYGTVDIPEIETFGSSQIDIPGLRYEAEHLSNREAPDPYMLKFASSAAHVTGKPLVSAESLTWLAEHFRTPLSLAKPELDQLFLSGINHVFFHGSTYSPEDYPWPGWLFYASVHFGPTNSFWHDLGAMNQYIARCQAVFQEAKPDNELLVYWPVYDIWKDPKHDKLFQLSVHNISEWLLPTPFYQLNKELNKGGWQTDYVSDHQLLEARISNGKLELPGASYKALLIPVAEKIPLETATKIIELAAAGATIVFQNIAIDVPGMHQYEDRSAKLDSLLKSFTVNEMNGLKTAHVGAGKIIIEQAMEKALDRLGIRNESIRDSGLNYLRMKHDNGHYYFLVNASDKAINQEIHLKTDFSDAVAMDPVNGKIRSLGVKEGKVPVHLKPGASVIIKTMKDGMPVNDPWVAFQEGRPITIDQPWEVTAIKGGPEKPAPFTTTALKSWVEQENGWAHFSGTARYSTTIALPESNALEYWLRFDHIGESARVYINGDSVGTIWSVPREIMVGDYLKAGTNNIEVLVTNLMANRIRYMDIKGMAWRNFHEINFVNIDYQPFDASGWEPMPSGMIGEVKLVPLVR